MTHAKRRIFALMPFLISCAIGFLSAAGPLAQAADPISGQWKINGNNYEGRMEISGRGGQYSGRVFYNVINHWEDLTNIRFDPRSRRIEFDRPEANQHYVGRLERDDRMEGTFGGAYNWWAERTGGGGREEGGDRERSAISGPWRINGNNYEGRMEFSGGGGQYSGRVFYDVIKHWEILTNIRFDRRSRRIEFDRPEANQHYVGRLERDNRMEGTFTGDYTWFAER